MQLLKEGEKIASGERFEWYDGVFSCGKGKRGRHGRENKNTICLQNCTLTEELSEANLTSRLPTGLLLTARLKKKIR